MEASGPTTPPHWCLHKLELRAGPSKLSLSEAHILYMEHPIATGRTSPNPAIAESRFFGRKAILHCFIWQGNLPWSSLEFTLVEKGSQTGESLVRKKSTHTRKNTVRARGLGHVFSSNSSQVIPRERNKGRKRNRRSLNKLLVVVPERNFGRGRGVAAKSRGPKGRESLSGLSRLAHQLTILILKDRRDGLFLSQPPTGAPESVKACPPLLEGPTLLLSKQSLQALLCSKGHCAKTSLSNMIAVTWVVKRR